MSSIGKCCYALEKCSALLSWTHSPRTQILNRSDSYAVWFFSGQSDACLNILTFYNTILIIYSLFPSLSSNSFPKRAVWSRDWAVNCTLRSASWSNYTGLYDGTEIQTRECPVNTPCTSWGLSAYTLGGWVQQVHWQWRVLEWEEGVQTKTKT